MCPLSRGILNVLRRTHKQMTDIAFVIALSTQAQNYQTLLFASWQKLTSPKRRKRGSLGTFRTTVLLCPLSSLIKLVFDSVPLLSQLALPHVNQEFSCKITKCSKLLFDWDRLKGESPPSRLSLTSIKPFSKAQETIMTSAGRQRTQSSWTGETSTSGPLTIGPCSPVEQGFLTCGPVFYCWSASCYSDKTLTEIEGEG